MGQCDHSTDTIASSLTSMEKLLLYASGSEDIVLRTKVKMQKLMFLVSKAMPQIADGNFRFEPHKKGPYSIEIEESLNSLNDCNLIELPSCEVTEEGKKIVKQIVPKQPLRGIVDELKSYITHLKEDELLLMIYVDYPEYRINSEEWERLKSKREELAKRMFEKGQVSVNRAAELAGVSEAEYADRLYADRVRWRSVY